MGKELLRMRSWALVEREFVQEDLLERILWLETVVLNVANEITYF